MRWMRCLGVLLAVCGAFLCGCGSNGSSKPASLGYSQLAPVFTKGVAVTADNPVFSGKTAVYSVNPALPAGLSLSSSTGILSGTPTAVSATASYVVTAAGSGGSASVTLSITVNDQKPTDLSYTARTSSYILNTPITVNTPTNRGGAVVSYAVSPALPAGLNLSTTTGAISGTPAAVSASTVYTVTGTNTGGTATATLVIAVTTSPSSAPAPPAGLVYNPGNAVYTVGLPITYNIPSSTGGAPTTYTDPSGTKIPAYSIYPPLPTGLSISSEPPPDTIGIDGTGIISGTPEVVSGPVSYRVTASNLSGSITSAPFTITVNATTTLSGLSYDAPAPVYVEGKAITKNKAHINNSGNAALSFIANPSLESIGLSIDPSDGSISGTPVAVPSAITPPPAATVGFTITVSDGTSTVSTPLTVTIYNATQAVPNMFQSLTPLEADGSNFQFLDTGMIVTDPYDTTVAPVEWLAGQAVSTAISPDNSTLLVLTSGFNRVYQGPFPMFDPQLSNEYVFIFDISSHSPVFKQALPIPNAYHGIVWDPSSTAFYVSGGMGDAPFGTDPIPYPEPNNGDNIHIVQQLGDGSWKSVAELDLGQTANGGTIAAGHPAGNGLPVPNNAFASVNAAVFVAPMAAGLAISPNGQELVVANYYNDSITVFTGGLSTWISQWTADASSAQKSSGTLQGFELDLRPGKAASGATPGTPGGEYPFWVVIGGTGFNIKAYVSSLRDREIDVVSLYQCPTLPSNLQCVLNPTVSVRIPVKGQPNKMAVNSAGTLLYVAEDESDTVDVIDIGSADVGVPIQTQPATQYKVIETISVIAPPDKLAAHTALTQYTGANTNSVTLSPDESTLYVTNGNLNNIAVVPLSGTNKGDHVAGLIPTGWYPNSIAISQDGSWAYVANSKSPTGPNTNWCYVYGPSGYPTCMPANQYNPQLTKAGLLSFPLAGLAAQFERLTDRVAENNRFASTESTEAATTMAAVHSGVQHVIYILKENRTYDQILGDLGRGDGDPALAMFGQEITPNQHRLAAQFVTLDNFLANAETSNDGWPWSTSARAPDVIEHQFPVNYAQRGLSLDSEGLNRNVNVALPTLAQRQAANPLMPGGALSPNVEGGEDLLPGQTDVAAPDGPGNQLNTGYLWDNAIRAGLSVHSYGFFVDTTCYNEPSCQTPLARDPYASRTVVAPSSNVALMQFTDPYFRGFDPSFPDYYRFKEWERDFDANYASGGLPNLSLVRFMHDHTGNFATAIDGVNTPDREVADNDYAVGLLVQKIANSPIYKNNTLIFVVEDDSQDGGDHVDSHRTTAYVAGAWVKNGVVSTRYNTVDLIRTMEEVMGLSPMNLNDALGKPMYDIFSTTPGAWSFTATPAAILYCTSLPLPSPALPCNSPTPNAQYWATATRGMDFTDSDRIDDDLLNRILWRGIMGDQPYPSRPSGKNLRENRGTLLDNYRRSIAHRNTAHLKAHAPKLTKVDND
jgi:DNA-binding beta-propeller fold protein YncE